MAPEFSTPRQADGNASSPDGQVGFESELQLRDIVLTLRRRKFIIVSGLILGFVCAALLTRVLTKVYAATSTIELTKQGGLSLGMDDLSGLGSQLGESDQQNTDLLTQEAVIESDDTALAAIRRLNLTEEAPYKVDYDKVKPGTPLALERGLPLESAPYTRERILAIFHQNLSVALVKGTRLITVKYNDTNPARATKIANAIVVAYIDGYSQSRYEASTKISTWLTDQLEDLKHKVEESHRKMSEFQQQAGLIGMTSPLNAQRGGSSETHNVPLERLIELNRDLTDAEVSRIAQEAIYRMTESQDPNVVLGIGTSHLANGAGVAYTSGPGGEELQHLQTLRQQQEQIRVEIATASVKYGPKSSVIGQLQMQDSTVADAIRQETRNIHMRARNDYQLALTAEDGIRARVKIQEQEVGKISNSSEQLLLLQQEEASNRQLYQDLYTKLKEANIAAGVRASNITVVNPARIPAHASSPVLMRFLQLGLLVGLIGGLVLAFAIDYFDDSILVPEQVEKLTAAPLLGVIPLFSDARTAYGIRYRSAIAKTEVSSNSESWLLKSPGSAVSESYRNLRTNIIMCRADRPPKVLLFTSGVSGEGKSTSCFNTAVAFALKGDRVLIIDADMRRPRMHTLMGFPNVNGLSQVLTLGRLADDVIQEYAEIPSLHILTAGVIPPMPSELLGSQRFAALVHDLREKYDYILIDTPPVLLVTDPLVVSAQADGVILVVRSGRTTLPALKRALLAFARAHIQFLGFVLNAADISSADYANYGYYAYGKYNYYTEASK